MRGFRASRAVQNFKSARFGRLDHQSSDKLGFGGQGPQQQQSKPELPAWLKMPQEQIDAQRKPQQVPHLRLVKSGPIEEVRPGAKKKTPKPKLVAKSAKAAAPKKKTIKATTVKAKTAKKRKAA